MGPLWPPITGYRRRSLKFGNGRLELCRPAGTRCKPHWSREALSCATPTSPADRLLLHPRQLVEICRDSNCRWMTNQWQVSPR